MSNTGTANPIYRVYFALDAPADSDAAGRIKAMPNRVVAQTKPSIEQVVRERRGSRAHAAFVALEIGFIVSEYDLALAEQGIAALFDELRRNVATLKGLMSKEVTSRLMVNINSKGTEHRPVLFLTTDQVALLADLHSTVELDGYLMIDS